MALVQVAEIALPTHTKAGGFDHAAVHAARDRVYVAHTANDAVDVIDGATARCVGSIPSLTGVAGVLVSEEQDLVFTSNRGEDSVAWFSPAREEQLVRVRVGPRPNGLAYDPRRNRLLCANVGDPARPGSWSVSIVDVAQHAVMAELPAPGRTRWALFDVATEAFYVNIGSRRRSWSSRRLTRSVSPGSCRFPWRGRMGWIWIPATGASSAGTSS
jgi:hypothetical protein